MTKLSRPPLTSHALSWIMALPEAVQPLCPRGSHMAAGNPRGTSECPKCPVSPLLFVSLVSRFTRKTSTCGRLLSDAPVQLTKAGLFRNHLSDQGDM